MLGVVKVVTFPVWVHCRVGKHPVTLYVVWFAFGRRFQPADVAGWGRFLATKLGGGASCARGPREPPSGRVRRCKSGRLSCLGPLQGWETLCHALTSGVCVWQAVSARRCGWLGAIFGQNWAVRAARADPGSPLQVALGVVKVVAFPVWVHCRVREHSVTLSLVWFAFGGRFEPADVAGWRRFCAQQGRCGLSAPTQAAPFRSR